MNNNKLSDSEKEIMEVVWNVNKSVCVNDIFDMICSEWKYTTLATFLTRLNKKGFLSCEKINNQNYYTAVIDRDAYLKQQTDEFVKDIYENSTADLIACLCKERVSKEDYDELMGILEKYGK